MSGLVSRQLCRHYEIRGGQTRHVHLSELPEKPRLHARNQIHLRQGSNRAPTPCYNAAGETEILFQLFQGKQLGSATGLSIGSVESRILSVRLHVLGHKLRTTGSSRKLFHSLFLLPGAQNGVAVPAPSGSNGSSRLLPSHQRTNGCVFCFLSIDNLGSLAIQHIGIFFPATCEQNNETFQLIGWFADLAQVERKVATGQYLFLSEFVKDVTKIFDNCRYFNSRDSPFYQCAEVLETFFVQKFKLIKEKI